MWFQNIYLLGCLNALLVTLVYYLAEKNNSVNKKKLGLFFICSFVISSSFLYLIVNEFEIKIDTSTILDSTVLPPTNDVLINTGTPKF